MIEIEAKVKLENPAKLRGLLKSAGAKYEGRALEKNWLYDHPERTLARNDKLLRLREKEKVSLTFKGPRERSEYKKREEMEICFPDASSARSLLEAVGFSQWFYYEKIRETWRLEASEIVLDELPGLGLFVEVEAPSDKEVEAIRKRLKLPREYINESYVELLQRLAKGPQGKLDFRFPQDHQSTLSASGNA
jgi:adenylate cyclase class 2